MFFLFVRRCSLFFALPCFLLPYHPSNISLYLFLTWQLFDSCWRVFCVFVCQSENCFACLFILPLLSLELSIGGRMLCYHKAHRFYIQHGIFCVASWILAQSSQLSEWLWFWCSHFIFLIFFLPHTIFLIRILRRMRNEIHVGDRDFVETKNVQVICKINYAWTEGEEWCCQNIQDTRNSKIQQSFVCDESYFTFATVFRSLSFFNGNALGSDEQSKNPMFLDFAKQALC